MAIKLAIIMTLQYAHQHQVESSHGLSLEFNGFVLMYNLLEDITESRVCNTVNLSDDIASCTIPYCI